MDQCNRLLPGVVVLAFLLLPLLLRTASHRNGPKFATSGEGYLLMFPIHNQWK